MRIGAGTDKGIAREVNQDCFYISGFDGNSNKNYFIIADGMGGHNAGEVASKFTVDFIRDYLDKELTLDKSGSRVINLLNEVIRQANSAIFKKSAEDENLAGMGTTVIICIINIDEGKLYTAHVGDSRLYLIHNNKINRITTDHSMVEELLSSGTITEEEAVQHPKKNVITRAIGGEITIKNDVFINSISEGDIVLVCTDGLTNMLDEQEILDTVKMNEDLQKAVDKLIELANLRGGLDNITVIAIGL